MIILSQPLCHSLQHQIESAVIFNPVNVQSQLLAVYKRQFLKWLLKNVLLKAVLTILVVQIKADLYCVEFIEAAYILIPGQSDTARVHGLWTECGCSFKRQLLKRQNTTYVLYRHTMHLSSLIISICQTQEESILNASHFLWISNALPKSLRAVNSVLASTHYSESQSLNPSM